MWIAQDGVSRFCRALFVLLMVIAWSDRGGVIARAAATEPQTAAGYEAEFGRLYAALEKADADLPRNTFDPAAIVKQVGKDPGKLFDWVRDHTYWVPYSGALRGPTGVLMDRVGSSLDRSLLLGQMLQLAGHNVRLAHAELPPDVAATLAAKVRPLPDDRFGRPADQKPLSTAQAADAQIAKYVRPFALDEARSRRSFMDVTLKSAKSAEDLVERAAEQTPTLADALGSIQPVPAGVQPSDQPSPAAVLADHWWVQCEANGQWMDLDPLLPDAKAGAAVVQATDTPPLVIQPGGSTLDERPCHEVELRVIVEQWVAGQLTERPVMTHVIRSGDVVGRTIRLTHLPKDWPEKLDLSGDDAALKLQAAAVAQQEWVPMLAVDQQDAIYQGSFKSTGDVTDTVTLDPLAGLGGKTAASAASKALDLDADPAAANGSATANGQLTAEWVEYEIRSPGQPARTHRRQVFDLLGPAARAAGQSPFTLTDTAKLERGLTLLGDIEILVAPCHLSQAYVSHLSTKAALANRAPVATLIKGIRDKKPANLADQVAKMTAPPGELQAFAIARGGSNRLAADIYYDRPNVFSIHRFVRVEPATASAPQRVVACRGFDVVENAVAVRLGSKLDPFRAQLEQGVWDTNAEAMMVAGCGLIENTAELFANAGPGDWITLRQEGDLEHLPATYPADARSRIGQDIAAGYCVVTPKDPAKLGERTAAAWWRIDPKTGQSLGMGQNGWGTASVEYIGLIRAVFSYAAMVFCILGFSSAKISGGAKAAGYAACVVAGGAGAASNAIGGLYAEAAATAGVVGVLADLASLGGAAAGYASGQ